MATVPYSGISWVPPVLPPGVTLQAIDGETMLTPTTMSNNYYSRNGYTQAANAGWDAPTFFPIGVGPSGPQVAGDITTLLSLNLNFCNTVDNDTNFAVFSSAAPWLLGAYNSDGSLSYTTGFSLPANYMVGFAYDEPNLTTDYQAGIIAMSSSTLLQRFLFVNYTHNLIGAGGPSPPGNASQQLATLTTNTASGRVVPIAASSEDAYWFNDSTQASGGAPSYGGTFYLAGTRSFTADECGRGCWYGDTTDAFRTYLNNGASGPSSGFTYGQSINYAPAARCPIHQWIENNTPDDAGNPILPAQLNWAVWQHIIHGGRLFSYFNFNTVGNVPSAPLYNFGSTNTTNIIGGQSISVFNQAAATNLLVKQLAPVINSPIGVSYVTVSPPGVTTFVNPTFTVSGFDITSRWYQGGNVTNAGLPLVNGFYIFASSRYGYSGYTSKTATFTINDSKATSVNVVGESRSISISGGTFSDTFATPDAIHIYQVVG
jgi:hypothetical protein